MLVVRLHPDQELRLHEESPPEPRADEALVRVGAVGLCGSDRHWIVDGGIGDAVLDSPLVLGHEFAGMAETGRFTGRLVAVDPAVPCERCELCRSDSANLCLALRFAGHGRTDGGLRELVAWPERSLHPLSDRLDVIEGALVEPLSIAVHAADIAGGVEGSTVAVVGCGPIGVLLVALACTARASTIVATDVLAHRRDAAAAYGATAVVDATSRGDERAVALESTGGRGFDVVFDASGEPEAVETAVELARPGGQVILVGIPPDDQTTFRASVARRKGLTLRLSRRSTPDSFRRAVEIAERRSFDLAGLVTHRVSLHEARRGFDALVAREGMKVIVEPAAPGAPTVEDHRG
jgi:L-iditol 2-dehydrogenase